MYDQETLTKSDKPLFELVYCGFDRRDMSSLYKCPICEKKYLYLFSNPRFTCECGAEVIFPDNYKS